MSGCGAQGPDAGTLGNAESEHVDTHIRWDSRYSEHKISWDGHSSFETDRLHPRVLADGARKKNAQDTDNLLVKKKARQRSSEGGCLAVRLP
jgi:hypothetical protein